MQKQLFHPDKALWYKKLSGILSQLLNAIGLNAQGRVKNAYSRGQMNAEADE
jgi:hypothetical protein